MCEYKTFTAKRRHDMAVVKGRHVISEEFSAYSMHFFNSLEHLRRDAPCSQLKVEQAHTKEK